jgi:REP element-mobilizing transposase RayT
MIPHLIPGRATWHITFGTYGTRLHGDERPTVDRKQNQRDKPFITSQPQLRQIQQHHMQSSEVLLNLPQRLAVQSNMQPICQRGQWNLHVVAAASNHVHVLLDAEINVDPKDIRKWLKRWIGQSLDSQFDKPPATTWWAKGGSTKPVKDQTYFENVYRYIAKQRAT